MDLPCTGQGGPWEGGGIKAGPGHTLGLLWEGGTYIPVPSLQLGGFSSCFCPASSCPSFSHAFFQPFYSSMCSFFHVSTHESTHLPIHACIHSSIYMPTLLPPSSFSSFSSFLPPPFYLFIFPPAHVSVLSVHLIQPIHPSICSPSSNQQTFMEHTWL